MIVLEQENSMIQRKLEKLGQYCLERRQQEKTKYIQYWRIAREEATRIFKSDKSRATSLNQKRNTGHYKELKQQFCYTGLLGIQNSEPKATTLITLQEKKKVLN